MSAHRETLAADFFDRFADKFDTLYDSRLGGRARSVRRFGGGPPRDLMHPADFPEFARSTITGA